MSRANRTSSKKKRESVESSHTKGKQSNQTKSKLIEFFSKTAELERKLQIIKEMLAEEQDFTPASLFHRFDSQRKGYLVEKDIELFLVGANIQFKGSQLKTLYGRINVNKADQGIVLREFQNFILPNQNPRLRYFTMRRPVLIPLPGQKLSEKIEWITAKFFTEIITEYTKLRQYNNALVNSFDFDANCIFNFLSSNKSTISGEDIDTFMREYGKELTKEEVGCVLKLIDKKGEGHIYADDFKHYLATLGLKKQHEIFDQLSPVPALRDYQAPDLVGDREASLKERYRDNKSYLTVPEHLGFSRDSPDVVKSGSFLSNSQKRRR